ncbi:hypothetical protein QWJ07_06180 [Frankia sp. RB7]|nr:hypothetical protein [Frankia sp. RB7]
MPRRRFKQNQSLEERLIEQAMRLRQEAIALPDGIAREETLSRAAQTEAAVQMSQWLRSKGDA